MTDMVDELIVWEGSLNLEVRIFSEQEKSEPLVDSFSSSTIGASLIGFDVWDKVGWGKISLIRPATFLLATQVDETVSSPCHGSSIGSVRTWWRVWIQCRINFTCSKKRIVDLSLLWSHELEDVKVDEEEMRGRDGPTRCTRNLWTQNFSIAENQTNWKRCHKYIFVLIK